MNLSKAIEINTIHNDHNPDFTDAERRDAHQLGIEALKRFQEGRPKCFISTVLLLPGETKE